MQNDAPDTMGDEEREAWFDEFLRQPTTLPEDLDITCTNFADQADAQKTADVVRVHLTIFGRLMDLNGLAQVFLTFDYPGTLAKLDRGFPAKNVLQPTNDDIAEGVAMAPSVKRDGFWKSVIVLNARYARALSYEPEPSFPDVEGLRKLKAQVVHILAHECGHVHDLAIKVKSIPQETLEKAWNRKEFILMGTANACWDEYIASRLSACYGNEETLEGLESSFVARLELAWPVITKSIRLYRMHGNVGRVLNEVALEIRKVLVYASYLLGHLAGLELLLADGAPKATAALKQSAEFAPFIERLQTECETIYAQYDKLPNLDVFDSLAELVQDVFQCAGLAITQDGDNTHVAIPHREDTMPSFSEQAEFMQQRIHGAI